MVEAQESKRTTESTKFKQVAKTGQAKLPSSEKLLVWYKAMWKRKQLCHSLNTTHLWN